MDRLPADILLEIIDWLSTNPTPSELYCFLAVCPEAAAAHAARPLMLDCSIDMHIEELETEIQMEMAKIRSLRFLSGCRMIVGPSYQWPSRNLRHQPDPRTKIKWLSPDKFIGPLRRTVEAQEGWDTFRTALGDRNELWRRSVFGRAQEEQLKSQGED